MHQKIENSSHVHSNFAFVKLMYQCLPEVRGERSTKLQKGADVESISSIVESMSTIIHISRSLWSWCGFISVHFTLEGQQKGSGHSARGMITSLPAFFA